jgi:hypothetical protein
MPPPVLRPISRARHYLEAERLSTLASKRIDNFIDTGVDHAYRAATLYQGQAHIHALLANCSEDVDLQAYEDSIPPDPWALP